MAKITLEELQSEGLGLGANTSKPSRVKRTQMTSSEAKIYKGVKAVGKGTSYDIARKTGYTVTGWFVKQLYSLVDKGYLDSYTMPHRPGVVKTIFKVAL